MDAELRAAVLRVAGEREMSDCLYRGERAHKRLKEALLTKPMQDIKLDIDLETVEMARIGREFLSLCLKAKEAAQ